MSVGVIRRCMGVAGVGKAGSERHGKTDVDEVLSIPGVGGIARGVARGSLVVVIQCRFRSCIAMGLETGLVCGSSSARHSGGSVRAGSGPDMHVEYMCVFGVIRACWDSGVAVARVA